MSHKHLDIHARARIQRGVEKGESFAAIARDLGVATSTVSREVRTNRTWHVPKGKRWNLCAHRADCDRAGVCGGCGLARCRSCAKVRCWEVCGEFEERRCDLLSRAPFVCGGCHRAFNCGFRQALYSAADAQLSYQARLAASREGVRLRPEELESLVHIVRRYLRRGWSLEAIWAVMGDLMPVSERTMYSYIEAGLMGLANIDLPKKVRYKPRGRVRECRVPDGADRSFDMFSELPAKTRARAVQMDTVIGRARDFKCILTLHVPSCELQLMVLLDEHSCSAVVGALDWIESVVGAAEFARLFGVILTDRGVEFCDHEAIERSSLTKGRRCRLFYCDPMRADQKGSCERNHGLIRRVLPKGTSFEGLTPWDVATVCSHVNSYPRRSLGGRSPLAAAARLVPKRLLDELGIVHMRPDEVVLRPELLGGAGR